MDSSFAMDPISQDQLLVIIALALVGVLAVLTIIGMVIGARMKRRRAAAEKLEKERIAELEADGVQPADGAEAAPLSTPATASATPPTPAPPPAEARTPAPSTPLVPSEVEEPATNETPDALSDEPIAAAAPLDASPASALADAPLAAPATDGSAPVSILKGLGPKIATRLNELGITRVDQLAWLDDAEAASLDSELGAFQGRMERDRWREQARLLAQGDRAGYEAQFGKLG
jgi:predicted flap endonuclease-1-like 5' DNA nuclease